MGMSREIELACKVGAELGEGPLWDVGEQRLYWIDSLGAKVHSCDSQGGAARTWNVPDHIGSLALRERGGAVLSLRDGFYALDFTDGACVTAKQFDSAFPYLTTPIPGSPQSAFEEASTNAVPAKPGACQ